MDFMIGQLLLLPNLLQPDLSAQAQIAPCKGQTLPINEFVNLFEAIGTRFGGDGQTDFKLPNIPPVKTAQGTPVPWSIVLDGSWFEEGNWAILGQVMPMVVPLPWGTQAAQQWLPCDGRLLPIDGNDALFSLLGNRFGGNAIQTFGLPKLPPIALADGNSLSYYIAVNGMFPATTDENNATCDAATPKPSDYGPFDAYISQIFQFPYQASMCDALCGFALCNGQTLSIARWTTLYSIIGTQFGGNGESTYLLPAIAPLDGGIAYAMITSGMYPALS